MLPEKPQSHDLLGHEKTASEIADRLNSLPDGTVISVEGDWGRGKTDLFARLYDIYTMHHRLWINPWKLKESIASALVTKIAAISDQFDSNSPDYDRAEVLLASSQAGLGILGVGAVAFSGPLAPATGATVVAGQVAIKGLRGWLDTIKKKARKEQEDLDPGLVFKGFVDKILANESTSQEGQNDKRRLVFFVDDMDRCLPSQQLAFLEDLHRFSKNEPRALFLVAVDSTILAGSLKSAYGDFFDGHAYLDKIFDLRLKLPQVDKHQANELIKGRFSDLVRHCDFGNTTFANGLKDVILTDVLSALGRRGTPRLLERVFLKSFYLFNNDTPTLAFSYGFAWLAISEAYPELRRQFRERLFRRKPPSVDIVKTLGESTDPSEKAVHLALENIAKHHIEKNPKMQLSTSKQAISGKTPDEVILDGLIQAEEMMSKLAL